MRSVRDSHRLVAAAGLLIGAVLGVAGTFVPSASWRGVLWGIDGTALVVAAALLAVHHLRRGNDLAAAGFFVFMAGQAVIVSTSAVELTASTPVFGAGLGLWAASLALVSGSDVMPVAIRGVGFIASLLFAIVSLQIFAGRGLTPLSEPLPFLAYPFFAATLLGWAWVHYRGSPPRATGAR